MTSLPPLTDWDATRDSLHRAAQLVAALQKAFSPTLPNALHLSLLVRPNGLITRPLRFGHAALDFTTAEITISLRAETLRFPLGGQSPRTLQNAILSRLADAKLTQLDAIAPVSDENPFIIAPQAATTYAEALWQIYTAIARVRAEWMGAVTPIVVWPHGFDLSTLYFPGGVPDEHTQPHLNVGFSPTSAGFPRPYIYAYVWPLPDGATLTPLPPLARWTTEQWTGVVIDYDRLRTTDQPVALLEDTLRTVFARLSQLL